jgi:heme exporter protein C
MPGIDSLHPGNGGNAPFSDLEVDGQLRRVFYPAMIRWILLGFWIAQITYRLNRSKRQLEELQEL